MNVSIVGSGNIAFHLAKALRKKGIIIQEICSRNHPSGRALAKHTGALFVKDPGKIKKPELLIIAVKDDAISKVVRSLPDWSDTVVIHTSGATDLTLLKKKFRNCGVLWMIQTIRKEADADLASIPLILEGSNDLTRKLLFKVCRKISRHVYEYTSEQRKVLHLAAVWANNFPNHLYAIAERILKKHRLPFRLLSPLILSTASNGIANPAAFQTGPAKRNDRRTMKAHLHLMPEKDFKALYRLLSKSIRSMNPD